jgi:hypothetical protein
LIISPLTVALDLIWTAPRFKWQLTGNVWRLLADIFRISQFDISDVI